MPKFRRMEDMLEIPRQMPMVNSLKLRICRRVNCSRDFGATPRGGGTEDTDQGTQVQNGLGLSVKKE